MKVSRSPGQQLLSQVQVWNVTEAVTLKATNVSTTELILKYLSKIWAVAKYHSKPNVQAQPRIAGVTGGESPIMWLELTLEWHQIAWGHLWLFSENAFALIQAT